ncbi:hypothetical protein BpHYR1_015940, partial [Brachionus plicatilis]
CEYRLFQEFPVLTNCPRISACRSAMKNQSDTDLKFKINNLKFKNFFLPNYEIFFRENRFLVKALGLRSSIAIKFWSLSESWDSTYSIWASFPSPISLNSIVVQLSQVITISCSYFLQSAGLKTTSRTKMSSLRSSKMDGCISNGCTFKEFRIIIKEN